MLTIACDHLETSQEEEIIAATLITDECRRILRGWIRSLRNQLRATNKHDKKALILRSELLQAKKDYRSYASDLNLLYSLS